MPVSFFLAVVSPQQHNNNNNNNNNISIVLLIIKDQKCFTCLKNKIVNLIKIINVEVIKSI